MIELVWLVPAIPLAASVVNLFAGRRLGRAAGTLGTAAVAASFAVSIVVVADLASLGGGHVVQHLFDWIHVGSLDVAIDLRVDELSAVMILVISGVGALIHLYSIGYMENDPRYGTFFAELNLFVAFMLVLVLANDFLLLFLGWEGVGLCSYLLIGFYEEKLSAGNAAKKAFITTRIGDTLMLIGIALIFIHFGTLGFQPVLGVGYDSGFGGSFPPDQGSVTIIALLLLAGAIGKSAQVPLHVWLPDAMEGPSPVSALIHAATMVTAGVYLVVRTHVLFEYSEVALAVVLVVGLVTLLYAGLAAIGQDDIKRVLAYSTISQLGFMFFAAGMGAYSIAMLMLVAHAFYKALMFLAAGSVMHGLDGELDLKRMGGLRRAMPATAAAFGIGTIALAGIPPLSGFFAKDPILTQAATSGRTFVWILALIGALISAVYISRPWFLAFFGTYAGDRHPHESPPIMTTPLAVLSVGAAGAGVLGLSAETGLMSRWLEPVVGELEHGQAGPPQALLIALSVAMAVIGIGISWYLWSGRIDWLEFRRRLGGVHPVLESGFGVDRLMSAIVQVPLTAGARLLAFVVDHRWIDGVVNATGAGVQGLAGWARRVQAGLVRRYALGMLLGAAAVLLYVGVRLLMPWLTVTVFLPLVGVPVLLAGRDLPDRAARWIGFVTSLTTFAVSLGVLANFASGTPGYQLVESATWVRSVDLRYTVGVDGISLFMVLLTTFLMPLAILASWKITRGVRLYMAAMLLLETAVVGSFLALDLLLFFLFFEALLFPMYLIIGGWGDDRRIYAAVKFFLYTMAGSAFLLVGILFLYSSSGSIEGGPTFDARVLEGLTPPVATGRWLFLAFFVAFAVKVPLFPLHTWLPDAHTEAPTAGSVILAGVLLKVGAYGLVRFNLSLFPEASRYFADAISVLALIGIVYGALVAMMQTDLKRLVAYSSVSHLGFVVLGIFAFTAEGASGGVLQMVNHGLSTGALFLLVGMVYERTHTRELGELGGLAKVMPWLAGTFLVVALSSLGLPGLNNFVGEFLVILGTLTANRVFGVIAASGVVLVAIYLLWSYQRAMLGEVPDRHKAHRDLSRREVVVIAPVVALLLLFGLQPNLLLERITPSTDSVLQRVGVAEPAAGAVGGAPGLAAAGGREGSAP